jgi:hypothetical protein
MDPGSLQFLLGSGVLAGAAFSTAVGTWRCGVAVGVRCGIAAAALLAAALLPLGLALLACGFRLS